MPLYFICLNGLYHFFGLNSLNRFYSLNNIIVGQGDTGSRVNELPYSALIYIQCMVIALTRVTLQDTIINNLYGNLSACCLPWHRQVTHRQAGDCI